MSDITPSHPDFDRSALTDGQYIEQLLFEIKELKSQMARMQLAAGGPETADSSGNNQRQQEREIPERSARRARGSGGESGGGGSGGGAAAAGGVSGNSTPERAVIEEVTGVAQSPSVSVNKMEGAMDEILCGSPKGRRGRVVAVDLAREVAVDKESKEMSNKETLNKDTLSPPKSHQKHQSDEVLGAIESQLDQISYQPQDDDMEFFSRRKGREKVGNRDEKLNDSYEKLNDSYEKLNDSHEKLNDSHQDSRDSHQLDSSTTETSGRSSVYSEEAPAPRDLTPTANSPPETSVDYSETSVDYTENSMVADQSVGSFDTYRSGDGHTLRPTGSYEQHNELFQQSNNSASSFQSYRSRIKLPPTLQQQAQVQAAQAQAQAAHAPVQANQANQSQSSVSQHENLSYEARTPQQSSMGFSSALASPVSPAHEPPKIPLPVSPDQTKSNVLSPSRGIPTSKTLRDLNIQNLKVEVPGRIGETSLRSPAVISSGHGDNGSGGGGNYSDNAGTSYRDSSGTSYRESPGGGRGSDSPGTEFSMDRARYNERYHERYHESGSSTTLATDSSTAHNGPLSSPYISHDPHRAPAHSSPYTAQSSPYDSNTSLDDVLFVKPEEFQTIAISIISTISPANSGHTSGQSSVKKLDETTVTIAIHDRNSGKEMWRIKKSLNQLLAFDHEIRPTIEYFGLPILPDKSLFFSTTPNKIDVRINGLQNYFNTLFMMPHIPHLILFRICKYLSLDVINPLDEFKSGASKEGYLVRKYKGLGTSWKVRWCQVEGSVLEMYDNPGGTLLESINLVGCQIGRQSNDSVAEEKGYRHAFLVMESQRQSKLTNSAPKHFFCAETDQERDDWVDILIEFSNIPDLEEELKVEETPKMELEYQDEIDSRSIKSPAIKSPTTRSHTTKSPAVSISSNQTNESEEKKKRSKRSYFPLKKKTYPLNNEEIEENVASLDSGIASRSFSSYLAKTNLEPQVLMVFRLDISKAYEISHHSLFGREIPSVCYRCLEYLLKTGAIHEEGIFRLSGSASTIKNLKNLFNEQYDVDLLELKPDIHTVAGLFKTYLRELPNPILGRQCYQYLRQIVMENGNESRTALKVRDYLNDPKNIDKIHFDVSYTILKFLKEVINNKDSNKMNLRNVCIVFVPTLNIASDVLSLLLVDFACIFENKEPIADDKREKLDLDILNLV